jgi:dual specificity phosphatase 12
MSTPKRPAIPQELGIKHKFILLEDDASTDLLEILDEACVFIDDALNIHEGGEMGESEKQANKALVHCLQGISRSGALVVAYTMKTLKLGYPEALEIVRKYV